MITFADGIATVSFVWPTNDTGGKVLAMMSQAAVTALAAAGYTVTRKPSFYDVRPAEGIGYMFRFTVPATPPAPTPEETP